MQTSEGTRELDDAALLAEPARRSLYEYVVGEGRDVGREEAARAVGLDRALAAFHLDRLVEAGFLETSFRRLSGRTGPGAGRPAKLYRRSAKRLELSIPARHYEVLARLLARGLTAGRSRATARELSAAARELGAELGAEARREAGPRAGRDRLLGAARRALARNGFEPYLGAAREIRLRNCPFDALAREYTDLVCGLNLEVMSSFVAGLGRAGIRATLDPQPGMCCVALRTG